jgi:iron(III) transport system substrate-binding protein
MSTWCWTIIFLEPPDYIFGAKFRKRENVGGATLMLCRTKIAAVLLVVTLLATACAPAATPTAGQPPESNQDALVEVGGTPADPGSLVIYSGRSESLVEPIIGQFADLTGIQVDVRYGSTAELAATILEEGSNSPADVFFAQDPGGLGAVADAGMLAELPEGLLNRVEARFRSPEGNWVGVSGRARVVVYNTDKLSPEDLPDELNGFGDPKWQGRIGWAPTNGSFQTMVTAMRQVWGEESTSEWLEGILANDPVVYENNTSIVAAVGAGEVDVGFVNHYYLYRFLQEEGEEFPARNYFLPGGGPGSLIMVAGVGRIASGPNEDNALKFIDFLLSPVAQQYFASQTFEYPVIEGIQTQRLLTPLSELDAIDIPLGSLADLQGTVELLQEVGALP